MRPLLPAILIALSLGLAACSQESDPGRTDAEASETSAPPAPAADTPAAPAEDDAPEPADTPEAASGDGYSSAYTRLDLESCRVIAQNRDEGGWVALRCAGYGGIPLFVTEGDLRFDVDAGVANDQFATLATFNTLGDTVEWRMRDGKPFAVIFRYNDDALETPERSVLAIEKIGTSGAPGCRVAQIAGDTPRANRRARQIADRDAASFDCSKEPRYIGNAQ